MVGLIALGFWICTIILAVVLGWAIGALCPRLRIRPCPTIWTASFRPISTEKNYFFLGSSKVAFQRQDSQNPLALGTLEAEPIKVQPKQRAHVFDDMTALESIRQEAKEILASENVWEGPDRVELMAELGLSHPKTPALVPLQDRKAIYAQLGPTKSGLTNCGLSNSGDSTRVVIHPRVRNEFVKLHAASEEPAETINGRDKVQAA